MTRREFAAAGFASLFAAHANAGHESTGTMGLQVYSCSIRARTEKGFTEPLRFIEFARSRGANAVQLSLGIRTDADSDAIRGLCEKLGMGIEGIASPPTAETASQERFAAELATARRCGASVVRTVLSRGRRYEAFDKPEDYVAFAKAAEATLARAEPIARRATVALAVENHKDFRVDEMIDALKTVSSEWVGVCVDTGNNIALLEDPMRTIEALAPFARSVHLKDMAVEDAADGFRLAEVPLGQGILDLKAIVAALRKGNPKVRFQLEMITRDPLSIPCLTEKYWATLGKVPAADLARTLAKVRAAARKEPLPRITKLTPAEQLAAEDRNVRESFLYVAKEKLL